MFLEGAVKLKIQFILHLTPFSSLRNGEKRRAFPTYYFHYIPNERESEVVAAFILSGWKKDDFLSAVSS